MFGNRSSCRVNVYFYVIKTTTFVKQMLQQAAQPAEWATREYNSSSGQWKVDAL